MAQMIGKMNSNNIKFSLKILKYKITSVFSLKLKTMNRNKMDFFQLLIFLMI